MEQGKIAVKPSGLSVDVSALEKGERRIKAAPVVVSAEAQQGTVSALSTDHQAIRPSKDNWDKLAALAPIISAALFFFTGSYCTYTFNQQQIRIQQCQTIEKFIPHLMGTEQSKKAAILALSTLINTETASKFASIFASTGTVSALQSLSQNGTEKDKLIATQGLSTALQNLADRESKLSTIEQDYKQAIVDKTKQSADNPDTPYNLNKLAQLYIIRGQYALAEPLLTRSLEIRERVYGPSHPEVVDALKSLAELYQLSGKTDLAESTLKRARGIEDKEGLNAQGQGEHAAATSTNDSVKPSVLEQPAKVESEKLQLQPPSSPPQSGEARAAESAGEQTRSESKQ